MIIWYWYFGFIFLSLVGSILLVSIPDWDGDRISKHDQCLLNIAQMEKEMDL